MNKENLSRLGPSACVAVAIIICSGWNVTARAEEAQLSDAGQIARGAKAWAGQCGRCHNIRDPKEMTDAQWSVAVSHMRVRASLPGQTARDIEAFLKAGN